MNVMYNQYNIQNDIWFQNITSLIDSVLFCHFMSPRPIEMAVADSLSFLYANADCYQSCSADSALGNTCYITSIDLAMEGICFSYKRLKKSLQADWEARISTIY